jgi:hypothetical protein
VLRLFSQGKTQRKNEKKCPQPKGVVGVLSLSNVFKNTTNHLSLAYYQILQELRHKKSFVMRVFFSVEGTRDEDIV